MEEKWAQINGYKISNYGKIIGKRNKPLSDKPDKSGYITTSINLGEGIGKISGRHRIIATIFIPNPYNLPEVNHIDGNKENNRADNLEWVTKKENQQHASHVLKKRAGIYNYHVKMTEEIVIEIYNECKNTNKKYIDIAKEYNIEPDAVRRIANGVTWKYLGLEPIGNIKDKPIIGTNILTGEIKKYKSARFAKEDGFDPSSISSCCTGKSKTHRGYKWEHDKQYIRNNT